MTALLSDLFGIQARSGCFCAGPYLHRLYGIDDEWSERMLAQIAAGQEGAKLAFTRVTFSYYTTEAAFDVHPERRSSAGRSRLEAAAPLPL